MRYESLFSFSRKCVILTGVFPLSVIFIQNFYVLKRLRLVLLKLHGRFCGGVYS